MNRFFFKLFLLITVLILSNVDLFAQYNWTKYPGNPLIVHGSSGSWNQSVTVPCVIFNSDLNRYEMWFTAFTGATPNPGIGFTYSSDGINWVPPVLVMTPGPASWESLFIGGVSVIKEGSVYKMWYTGFSPLQIGYATSPDGITWTKYSGNPVLSPGTGWESGGVAYPSVIKVQGGYRMFYMGKVSSGISRTGRAFSTDGINWQKDTLNNPVLLAGGTGQWDQNNFLARVVEINNKLYMCYTGESVPGSNSTTAIGFATSVDMGIIWTKDPASPIITQGTPGSWDYGRIETGGILFKDDTLKIYYDGGGPATGNMGRVGLATAPCPLPLSAGTYTVGTGGNFATIQDAFEKLETDGVAGNVTLELIDDLYTAPTTQYGFQLNGPIPGASPNSRVTIKPAENKNVVIEGNGQDVLSAFNTSYVNIDGVGLTGPTTLTVHALYNNQFGWNAGIEFIDNSDHNIFRDIIFISDDINRGGGGPGLYTRVGINAVADSNLFENNFIKKCGAGAIYLAFNNATLRGTGNIIRGNFLGSETDSVLGWGIQVEHAQNTIIENNIIQNLKYTPTQLSNTINVGINSYSGLGDIIRNNVVHNIKSTQGYTCVGILLSGGSGSNNMVYNNMVYNIQSTSPQIDSRVAGIQIWNQSNPKIYYNTVYLSGSGTGLNQAGSAAFYVYGGFSGSTGVDLKNNILINTRDEGQQCASAIYDYTASNLSSDYNDLYYDDTNNNNCLVRIAGTHYQTLADWQATGKDVHSYVEMPHFVSSTDLHIDGSIPTYIEGRATPIAGIEDDFDGDLRSTLTPDIGADEIHGTPGVGDEETVPTEYALGQNYPNPFNPSTVISYKLPVSGDVTLKVFDILGNEVATLVSEYKPAGKYEVEFNASALPSGVYFYQLNAGSFVETKKMILLK